MSAGFEVVKVASNAEECGWAEVRELLPTDAVPTASRDLASVLHASPLVQFYVVLDKNVGLSYSLPPQSSWAKVRYTSVKPPKSFTVFWTLAE
jgi:hypothetical protein